MIRFHRTCCWHHRKRARRWRAVIAGFLAALRTWRLAACSRFLIVWSETHVSYRRANLACRFLENSLWFRNADKVMKWSSCSIVFFGRPLLGLSLTSAVSWNLAFHLEMVPGLTPNRPATSFCGTQLQFDLLPGPFRHLIIVAWCFGKVTDQTVVKWPLSKTH